MCAIGCGIVDFDANRRRFRCAVSHLANRYVQKHFKALERSSDVHPESGRRRDREHSALRLSLAAALAECGMCRPPVAGVRRGEA